MKKLEDVTPTDFKSFDNLIGSLNTLIKLLESVKTRQDFFEAIQKYKSEIHKSEKIACLFIDKKKNEVAYESYVKISSNLMESFKKCAIESCKNKQDYDEDLQKEGSCNNWAIFSYGHSLHYERLTCFLGIPKTSPPSSCEMIYVKSILPYIHSAFGNILHHEKAKERVNLSSRQLQIIEWISKGKTNKEIAIILSVSQFTVKNHVANIYEKLNVVNRAQAIEKMMRFHDIS